MALYTPWCPQDRDLENGVQRDETPAHEALREALINALIHGDYAAPGGLVVEQWPHEVAIENGGTLLIALEQYQRGGVSECRNVGLQQMFLMIRGGEHAGPGRQDPFRLAFPALARSTP